jgi:acetyl esterase
MLERVAPITLALALVLSGVASAQRGAQPAPTTAQYGPQMDETAVVYPSGAIPLLLLHEKGQTTSALASKAKVLQREGFTVFNLEWKPASGKKGIFPAETEQIETAVAYVRAHAAQWSVDPSKLVMVGASRGALLALLVGERENALARGTVKAVVSLSGQVNPQASIERARRGELESVMTGTLAQAFGCTKDLSSCPEAYVREWSPLDKVTSSAPAMLLAASESERRAWVPDQFEAAEALHTAGVAASVSVASAGHGFGYWGQVRAQAIAFLRAQA